MPQLLTEWERIHYDSKLVKEDRAGNGGRLMMKCVMQRVDTENQNKRIYPRSILSREFAAYQKCIDENRALGECDHPETSTVSLEKVSHVIREQWWEENKWMGRLEVLPTPMGKILETLVDSGITIGISSRGVGTTTKNESGADLVQDDYTLVCFDLVAEPSTPGAYLFRESVERPALPRADRINRALNALKGFGK